MLERPEYPKERLCMVVTDYPIKTEVEQEEPYCSASNMTLMGDLHKIGIKQKECYFTYFSYERPTKESYDYINDFSKHASLEPVGGGKLGLLGEEYHQISSQKDLYMSNTLWKEFQGLLENIRKVKPKLIIVTGKWSLLFLTACTTYAKTQGNFKDAKPQGGLNKFRASMLKVHESLELGDILVFPMLPTITKMRSPEKIPILKWDLNKAGAIYKDVVAGKSKKYLEPKREFFYQLNLESIIKHLTEFIKEVELKPTLVSVDIETRHATIDCIGITTKVNQGLCIPFSTLENPHIWNSEDEFELVALLKKLLLLPNCRIVGQNFSYDAQYLYKFWLLDVHAYLDTMVLHHVMFNYMPKSLDFLASVYSDNYKYWKDMQSHGK